MISASCCPFPSQPTLGADLFLDEEITATTTVRVRTWLVLLQALQHLPEAVEAGFEVLDDFRSQFVRLR